ncbi:MAG: hypothetical protein WD071_09935 [Pseudohongiella sp.]|uniref:hypothetical protein n=1 Tax=Pseudohongiella sp. TaxID=1979412 RepID=UPI00349FE4BD
MNTTQHPQNTNQDTRPEPPILTDLQLDDDPDTRHIPESTRILPVTLLISLSAHVIILALAAYAANRDGHQVEQTTAQPSIQIRLQQPPTQATAASNNEELPSPPDDPVTTDEAIPSTDTETAEPDTLTTETLAQQPTLIEEPATPAAPPSVQVPSLTDLRTAARNRAGQDRESRSMHPDCLTRERRSAFLDCDEDAGYDYASAEHNDTYAFFNPTLPDQPVNNATEQTTTTARVKATIDMFDNQLGTTQVKRRIMNVQ